MSDPLNIIKRAIFELSINLLKISHRIDADLVKPGEFVIANRMLVATDEPPDTLGAIRRRQTTRVSPVLVGVNIIEELREVQCDL